MKVASFFAELKRRNVYKVAIAYAVIAWLLMQIATQVFPFLEIPNWAIRLVIMLLALGFPIALIIAWAFELTPEGLKRTEDVDVSKSITHTFTKSDPAKTSAALLNYSLRDLYRALEQPGDNPLREAHTGLDVAVRSAYGMPADVDALAFLLELNLACAAKEKAGEKITPPGLPLPPDELTKFVSEDCIQAPPL